MNPEVPNGTQNQTQPQPTVQPVSQNTEQPPSPRSFKKYIIGIIIVVILIIGLLAYFLLHKPDHYQFTINNTAIPENDFKNVFSYYKNQNSQTTQQALTNTKNLFIEDYVLKNEFLKTHSKNDLAPTNGSDSRYQVLNAQIIQMRNAIFPAIGLKTRSGELLRLRATKPLSATETATLTALMQQRLSFYKQQFDNKTPFNKVEKNFLADSQIKSQPKIISDTARFIDMTPQHPSFDGKNLIFEVFSANANTMTTDIDMSNDRFLMYGIIYISDAKNGNYKDPRQWLNQQEKQLKIITNFSDIQ